MAEENAQPLNYIPEVILKKRKSSEAWALRKKEQFQMRNFKSKFNSRKFESCKHLDLEWFLNNGFVFPQLLLQQNLEKFCTLSGNVYLKCVYEFYTNLVKKNNDWVTEVKGERIWVNYATLFEVAGLQNDGLKYDDMMKSNWVGSNFITTFLNCLHPNKSYDGRQMKVGLMTVNHRLLHYVIVYLLLPRLHNRAQPSEEDLKVMYSFKHKIQINWADFILMHMIRRHKNPSGALPYPVLISKIIEYARVDVSNEVKLSLRDHADVIDKFTIHKMQIGKFDGIWQWIEDVEPGKHQDAEECEKAANNQEASQFDNISLSDLRVQMQDFMREQLSLLRSKMDENNQRIEHLKERLNYGITLLKYVLGNKENDLTNQPSSFKS